MPNWITDVLKIILPGIIVAVFTSILTVRLAIRRFHKEKWWEKKIGAYTSLLEILHLKKNYATEYLDGEMDPNHLTNEKRQELQNDWKKFSREFAKLSDLASFYLSDEAVAILDEYEKKKTEARKSKALFEWIDGDLAAVTECLEKLKNAAKRDLKINTKRNVL